jgi:SPP1 family predicted phage head-tail adaptor
MSAGRKRHYVRVRIPVVTDDGEGGQTATWTNGPALWADVQPVSAREQSIAGAIQTIATHRVRLDFDARVTGERRLARIAPTGPELQILGVRDLDGRQRWMELDCTEVV